MDPTGGIVSYVVNKLGDLLISEAKLLGNTRRDLEWVQRELRMMQTVLGHVDTMKIQDARITEWIEDVRKLSFQAEDVVDTFSCRIGIAARKSSFFRFMSQTELKHEFGTKITELKESVAEVKRQKETYGIPDTSSAAGAVDQMDELLLFRRLRAAPDIEDRDVVGLEHHVEEVTALVLRERSKRTVVSIVGMGGLGKTTLAKKVYNNLLRLSPSSSFGYTAWVDVSQKYTLLDLLRRILNLSPSEGQEMNEEALVKRLKGLLQPRKHLIVLDDVWTFESWNTLNDILPDPNNGSRIIITTRNKEVVSSANPSIPPYELSFLSEEDSILLFTKKVFLDEENSEQYCRDKGLTSLREEIVRKCRGLPLAIIVVAGLLSTKEESPAAWKKVADKIDWFESQMGKQWKGILALSYIDLPIHLRWCFLYLGALPEDCEASAKRLMMLWIAEGFIEEKNGKSMEECAERYLEELAQRCLIQIVERKRHRTVERQCRVHDMILELAVTEAKKIRFLDVWRSAHEECPGSQIRRLSYTSDKIKENTTHLPLDSNKLRTLLVMDRRDWEYGLGTCFWNTVEGNIKWSSLQRSLKLVRVLEIALCLDELTEEIKDMANLRYLALSGYNIKRLPKSLGKLRHLQTLDVGGTKVEWFPDSIWQIKTLRYLRGSYNQITDLATTRLPVPKTSLGTNVFQNVRTLRPVHVDPWMETILPCLIHLKELQVLNVDQDSISSYLSSTLKKLQKLEVLILDSRHPKTKFNIDEIFSQTHDSHTYLHCLELCVFQVESSQRGRLPQNLMQASLYYAEFDHNVLDLLGNLKYLRHLKLFAGSFTVGVMAFKSEWFPQLHVLLLCKLDIQSWVLEGQSLPLLRELIIRNCNNLEELPEGLQNIQTLKEFEFLGRTSLGQSLKRREGADWDKVKHIERVYIDLSEK